MDYEVFNLGTRNDLVALTTTSKEVSPAMAGSLIRTQFIITNTSAAETITFTKGTTPAVANTGIILQPKGTYLESSDGGFICWNGSIQAVATGNCNVSISETFAERI